MIRSPAGAPSRWKYIPAVPVLMAALALAAAADDARGQAAAPGQPAPGAAVPPLASVPANVKEINSAGDLKQHLKSIESVVTAAIANLANDQNPTQQTRARTALISDAMINGQPNATATYLDAYAQIVNQQLLPLAKNPSPRVRLNAAIVAAEVARIADNSQLAPVALVFLDDKSDAIVLWGMKAARWIIPAQLRFPGAFNRQLADAVLPTVQKHSKGQVAGAIAVEAYDALTLNLLNNQATFAKMTPQQVATMAPYVLNLLQSRIPMYQKGVPPAPRAETAGTRYLTDPKTWPTLGAQQVPAVQAMRDLIFLATAQAQTANPGDRAELAHTVQWAGAAVATLVPQAQGRAIQKAAEFNPNVATPQQVQAVADSVAAGLQAAPAFAKLKPPPQLQGNEPAPPPASAPTTGNVLIPGATTQQSPGVAVPPGTTPAGGGASRPPAGAGATKPPGNGQTPRPTAKPDGGTPEGAQPDPTVKPGTRTPRDPKAGAGAGAGGPGAGAPAAGGTAPQAPRQ